jgi:thioredoxin reductase
MMKLNNMKKAGFDLIIIGGGAGAFAAAIIITSNQANDRNL